MNPTIMAIGKTEIDEDALQPIKTTVVVKCNHKKQKVDLIDVETRTGTEIMKQLSDRLRIPLNSLKVVGKGKLLHAENIKDMLIQNKCRMFQVIATRWYYCNEQ